MSTSGTNRRILRAFYSQYVAVLLIILVLSVGTVHNSRGSTSKASSVGTLVSNSPTIGTVTLHNLLSRDIAGQLRQTEELVALVEILRNHDLRADFTIPASVMGERKANIIAAIAQANAIGRALTSAGVPLEAVRLFVSEQQGAASDVTVSFQSMRGRNEHS